VEKILLFLNGLRGDFGEFLWGIGSNTEKKEHNTEKKKLMIE